MELQILSAITGPEVIVLAVLLAANIILSIIAAIAKGTFSFTELPKFVPNRIWPLIAYLIVAALADYATGWTSIVVAVYLGLTALYTTGILKALKSLTGLPLPDVLTEKREK